MTMTAAEKYQSGGSPARPESLEMQPAHRRDSQETAVARSPTAASYNSGWPNKVPENRDARFSATKTQV